MKIETSERRSLWHKYISIAVLNYNTSYHSSIGCEPSRVFHGPIPYIIPDFKCVFVQRKFPLQIQKSHKTCLNKRKYFSKASAEMPCKLISDTKRNMIKKANTSKLQKSDYVYIVQPEEDHQGSKIPFTEVRWIGPYIVEKALPNNSYLVQKRGTNKPMSFIA